MHNFALMAMAGLIAVSSISSIAYTFSKCGPKAFLLGSGAVYAAVSGMCDE